MKLLRRDVIRQGVAFDTTFDLTDIGAGFIVFTVDELAGSPIDITHRLAAADTFQRVYVQNIAAGFDANVRSFGFNLAGGLMRVNLGGATMRFTIEFYEGRGVAFGCVPLQLVSANIAAGGSFTPAGFQVEGPFKHFQIGLHTERQCRLQISGNDGGPGGGSFRTTLTHAATDGGYTFTGLLPANRSLGLRVVNDDAANANDVAVSVWGYFG